MNENKNPKLAKINETVSELLPFLRKSSNQPSITSPSLAIFSFNLCHYACKCIFTNWAKCTVARVL